MKLNFDSRAMLAPCHPEPFSLVSPKTFSRAPTPGHLISFPIAHDTHYQHGYYQKIGHKSLASYRS